MEDPKLNLGLDKYAWIAARYDGNKLPQEFRLGDGLKPGNGNYVNKPLKKGHTYRVFVRSYTAPSVSNTYII